MWHIKTLSHYFHGLSVGGISHCRLVGDLGSIPGLGRSPGEGNGNPLQYSCLENPMDRGGWRGTVHGVAKSQTQLSRHACTLCGSTVNNNTLHSLPSLACVVFSTALKAIWSNIFNKSINHMQTLQDTLYSLWVVGGLVTKSYRTLCHPMDCSRPASSVHGIFQARIL